MKIRLLALATIIAASALPAFAQYEDTTDNYKAMWKGVASLRTLQTKQKARQLKAVYPIFKSSRPVARVAGAVLKTKIAYDYHTFEKSSRGGLSAIELAGGLKYELSIKPYLELNHPRLISMTTMSSNYEGGAHGMYQTSGYVFGYPTPGATPRQLHLGDFFTTDVATTRKRVNALLIAKLRTTKQEATWVLDGSVKSVTNDQMENFSADADGLKWYFPPYAMGPFAAGEYTIKITTRELGPTFRASLLR